MSVLVIGGNKGIGKAIALRFARDGQNVVIVGHSDHEAGERTAAQIRDLGVQSRFIVGDIGTPHGAAAIFEEVGRITSSLTSLIHSAVYPASGSLLDLKTDELERSMSVGALSLVYAVKAGRPLLQSGSSVVYISSSGSYRAVPRYGAIGSAKAAAEAFIRYLAVELAPHGIRANTVSSGPVGTDAYFSVFPDAEQRLETAAKQSPAHRAQTVDDVAEVVFSLCQPAMEMVQGQHVRVDGGLYL